jgi:hypothetical protein
LSLVDPTAADGGRGPSRLSPWMFALGRLEMNPLAHFSVVVMYNTSSAG